jgi:surface antigen
VSPLPNAGAQQGDNCREYQSTVTIDGRPQPTYGRACLQPDGTWRIVQ